MDAHALGHYLRDNRTLKELSLDEAVDALKIRRNILEAFENGEFGVSENKVQVRGMLRNYALFLGLDADLVLRYYDTSQAPPRSSKKSSQETPLVAPRRITDTPPAMPKVTLSTSRARIQWGSIAFIGVMVFATLASLGVIGVVIVDFLQLPDDTALAVTAPATDITDTLSTVNTLQPTSTFALPPTPTPPLTGPLIGELTVILNTTQRTWLQVMGDGQQQFAGVVRPNETLTFSATSRLSLTASNAVALDVMFNGQQQRTFGLRGQRVEAIFTSAGVDIVRGEEGIFEPTPVVSPTPQPTPTDIAGTVIARLTPSPTPGPSLTPTITPTVTLTPSVSPSPSVTPSPTLTLTPTLTPSVTLTPSNTPTETNTPTITPTPTETNTPTITPVLPPRETSTPLSTPKP